MTLAGDTRRSICASGAVLLLGQIAQDSRLLKDTLLRLSQKIQSAVGIVKIALGHLIGIVLVHAEGCEKFYPGLGRFDDRPHVDRPLPGIEKIIEGPFGQVRMKAGTHQIIESNR